MIEKNTLLVKTFLENNDIIVKKKNGFMGGPLDAQTLGYQENMPRLPLTLAR